MLRALLALLLLANAAFYAWSQNWLSPRLAGPRPEVREPERLQAQQRPELITVMTPKAASAALAAAVGETEVCLEAGPFSSDANVAAAEFLLGRNLHPESRNRTGFGVGARRRLPGAAGQRRRRRSEHVVEDAEEDAAVTRRPPGTGAAAGAGGPRRPRRPEMARRPGRNLERRT